MSLRLITGATGWLGTRLVRVLIEGLEGFTMDGEDGQVRVRCLAEPASDTTVLRSFGSSAEVLEGDLRREEDVSTFCKDAEGSTLFHCAGTIHPHSRVKEFYDVNVDGTRRLLRLAEEMGVRRAVIVSSNSPMGTNPAAESLFDEETPYHPYMNYGRSKMLMEQLVHETESRGKLETVIIRPPWFYGPDQPPRQTLFFTMIKEGKAPIVGSGQNRRSMAYVDNICQGLLRCERAEKARGQTYWIADAAPYTMNQIVDTIERLLEEEFDMTVAHKRMWLPSLASDVAWLADWGLQRLGLYHQKIHVLSEVNKHIACSIAKARKELGYDPRISLEEGMRRSIQWCFDQGHRI